MSRYSKGDRVVATKDFGGVARDSIKKGTRGVVVEGGWGNPATVLFHVKGFFSDRDVEVDVDDDEIG